VAKRDAAAAKRFFRKVFSSSNNPNTASHQCR
jgi:transposase-like protein